MENQASQATAQQPIQQPEDDEINLMELLLVIAKHNRFIIKLTGGAAVLAVVVSLLMPNIYTGRTVIMPPQQDVSLAGMLMGQITGLGGAGAAAGGLGAALGLKNPNDIYVGMLQSNGIADHLIARFKLMELYGPSFKLMELYGNYTMVETRKELADNVKVTAGKDGLIVIEFEDEDPNRAADIANAYVEELSRLSQDLNVMDAAPRRKFFEKQLKGVKEGLANAENSLRQTQEKTGLIQLEAQGQAIIEAVAGLRAQVAAKEAEIAAMRAFATAQNPDYRQAREVLSGLKEQLAKAERDNQMGGGEVLVPTGKIPEAGLEYMRKLRNVKYYEKFYELMVQQFELARIDEAKGPTSIQVVDKALPPDKKSKPNRVLIVLLATILSMLVGIFWVFFKEATERAKQDSEQVERIRLLRRYFRQGK